MLSPVTLKEMPAASPVPVLRTIPTPVFPSSKKMGLPLRPAKHSYQSGLCCIHLRLGSQQSLLDRELSNFLEERELRLRKGSKSS
jgi:hypothetical protein